MRALLSVLDSNSGWWVELEDGRTLGPLYGVGNTPYEIIKKSRQETYFGSKYPGEVEEGHLEIFRQSIAEYDKIQRDLRRSCEETVYTLHRKGKLKGVVPHHLLPTALEKFPEYLQMVLRYNGRKEKGYVVMDLPPTTNLIFRINTETNKEEVVVGDLISSEPEAVDCIYAVCSDAVLASGNFLFSGFPRVIPTEPYNFLQNRELPVTIAGHFRPELEAYLEKEVCDTEGRKCSIVAVQSKKGRPGRGSNTLDFLVMGVWECRRLFEEGVLDLPDIPEKNMIFGQSQDWWETNEEIMYYLK